MPRVYVQEYRDQFDHTKYPFADSASLEGTITIPKELFVDASFYIPNVNSPIYLSSIEVEVDKITITISDTEGLHSCTGVVDLSTDIIEFFESRGFKVGCMVAGSAGFYYLRSLDNGLYTFYPKATEICARCCIVSPDIGVTSLSVEGYDEVLYGDVWLVGGPGVVLTNPSEQTICINVVGDPCYKRANCVSNNQFKTLNYIQKINGKSPDIYGNINISAAPIDPDNISTIRVITKDNSVIIKTVDS